jgi:hypothetical protein
LELSLDAWPNIGVRKSLKPIKVNEAFTSVNFAADSGRADASLQQVDVTPEQELESERETGGLYP